VRLLNRHQRRENAEEEEERDTPEEELIATHCERRESDHDEGFGQRTGINVYRW